MTKRADLILHLSLKIGKFKLEDSQAGRVVSTTKMMFLELMDEYPSLREDVLSVTGEPGGRRWNQFIKALEKEVYLDLKGLVFPNHAR